MGSDRQRGTGRSHRRPWVWSVLWILACDGNGNAPPPSVERALPETDRLLVAAARVALPPPLDPSVGLPAPESEGARLVMRYCADCHEVPTPLIHSATDWPMVARRMWLRIDGVPDSMTLARPTDAERTVLLRYLVTNALKTSGAPLPDAPGRHTYIGLCGRCHALPDLRTHILEDWSAVITRMGERMTDMLGRPLQPAEHDSVVDYIRAVVTPDPGP